MNQGRRQSDQWTVTRVLSVASTVMGIVGVVLSIGIAIGWARAADQRGVETHEEVQTKIKPRLSALEAKAAAQQEINASLIKQLDEWKGDMAKDLDEVKALLRDLQRDLRGRP